MSVADETRSLADDMADPVWLLCPSADDPTLPAGTGCTSVTVQVSCPVVTVTNVGEAPATVVAEGDILRTLAPGESLSIDVTTLAARTSPVLVNGTPVWLPEDSTCPPVRTTVSCPNITITNLTTRPLTSTRLVDIEELIAPGQSLTLDVSSEALNRFPVWVDGDVVYDPAVTPCASFESALSCPTLTVTNLTGRTLAVERFAVPFGSRPDPAMEFLAPHGTLLLNLRSTGDAVTVDGRLVFDPAQHPCPVTAVAGEQQRLSDTGVGLLLPLALGVGLLGIGGLFLVHGGRRGHRAGA